jgi:hypothetical protein
VVVSSNLVGLPILWSIVLEAKDWQVARQAIALLNHTHKSIAPALTTTAGEHLVEYISECMQYLSVAFCERSEFKLHRCIALLLAIVEEFETKSKLADGTHSFSQYTFLSFILFFYIFYLFYSFELLMI